MRAERFANVFDNRIAAMSPMPLRIDILTLFPEMFAPVLGTSIPKRAAEKGLVSYHLTHLRDFATEIGRAHV